MKAVIFDLDDTLYPEISYCLSGYRVIAKHLCTRAVDTEENLYKKMVSLFNEDSKMVFNRLLDSYGIGYEKSDIMELIGIYRDHFPDIVFDEGVTELLDELKKRGIKTGLLTDGYKVAQRQKLKALGADRFFDGIIVTDEIGREAWKPSKLGFEILAERFGCKMHDMIYVGDNPNKDFYLSVTAGVKTARVTRENGVYRDAEYFEGIRENYRLETLSDILNYCGD